MPRSLAEEETAGRRVQIYDTTLRDGSQGVGMALSVGDKLKIAEALDAFGVDYIEGGWPGANPKDEEFFERAKSELRLRNARLCAFGSTRRKGKNCAEDRQVAALLASEAPVVTLVAKAWATQVELVLETTLEENLAMIRDTVRYLGEEHGREVHVDMEHFYDGWKADSEYASACVAAAVEAGARAVVLCDTNGGSMPWEVDFITRDVVALVDGVGAGLHARENACQVGCHCHNDCGMAVANSLSALRAGAGVVQGCINGYGERTGNADLVSIIGTLELKLGAHCIKGEAAPGEGVRELTTLSRTVANIANQTLNGAAPYVGVNAFAHKGGLHVSATRKMENAYQHIDPALVGNRTRSVVSEMSGRANLLTAADRIGLLVSEQVGDSVGGSGAAGGSLTGDDTALVLQEIKSLENAGYTFEGAQATVDMMLRRSLPSYVAPFKVLEFSVTTGNRDLPNQKYHLAGTSANQFAQAVTKVRIGDTEQLTVAEGVGPVNALSVALKAALTPHFPFLQYVELCDYKVNILDAESETAATTRVTIEFRALEVVDGMNSAACQETWTTVGAHPNIIEATFRALVDGFETSIVGSEECIADDWS